MRTISAVLTFSLFLCFASLLEAQTSSTGSNPSSAQALATLQSALTALAGRSTVSDVTLTGNAERIAGSDNETGTATYRALLTANRLDMAVSGGTRSEIESLGTNGQSGTWIGLDGVTHSMAYQNLLTDPGWFPLFALQNINSSPNSLITYIGPETRNNVPVIHLSALQQIASPTGSSTALMQHLTQVDIYLNASTCLPVSYVFNIHPDDNALLDIPTEIDYSNYQNVGGVQIPFHVQKFVNNSLVLDLQFQNASLNTGITAAQIGAQ